MAIDISNGFEVASKDPIDSRLVINGRTTIDPLVAYEGLIVYDTSVSDDDRIYVLKNATAPQTESSWELVGRGGSEPIDDSNYAKLDQANQFTAFQTVELTTNSSPTYVAGIKLQGNDPNPAAGDAVLGVTFSGPNSNGTDEVYAGTYGIIEDPTASTSKGGFAIEVKNGNTLDKRFEVGTGKTDLYGQTTFNKESDSNSNTFPTARGTVGQTLAQGADGVLVWSTAGDLNDYARKDQTNEFTADQTISSTTTGGNVDDVLRLTRKATGANGHSLNSIAYVGDDATNIARTFARTGGYIQGALPAQLRGGYRIDLMNGVNSSTHFDVNATGTNLYGVLKINTENADNDLVFPNSRGTQGQVLGLGTGGQLEFVDQGGGGTGPGLGDNNTWTGTNTFNAATTVAASFAANQLSVVGASSFNSTIAVTGTSTLTSVNASGKVTITDELDVNGAVDMTGAVKVGGNLAANFTSTFMGAATFDNSVGVKGQFTINDTGDTNDVKFPLNRGTNGQYMVINGSGQLGWTDAPSTDNFAVTNGPNTFAGTQTFATIDTTQLNTTGETTLGGNAIVDGTFAINGNVSTDKVEFPSDRGTVGQIMALTNDPDGKMEWITPAAGGGDAVLSANNVFTGETNTFKDVRVDNIALNQGSGPVSIDYAPNLAANDLADGGTIASLNLVTPVKKSDNTLTPAKAILDVDHQYTEVGANSATVNTVSKRSRFPITDGSTADAFQAVTDKLDGQDISYIEEAKRAEGSQTFDFYTQTFTTVTTDDTNMNNHAFANIEVGSVNNTYLSETGEIRIFATNNSGRAAADANAVRGIVVRHDGIRMNVNRDANGVYADNEYVMPLTKGDAGTFIVADGQGDTSFTNQIPTLRFSDLAPCNTNQLVGEVCHSTSGPDNNGYVQLFFRAEIPS